MYFDPAFPDWGAKATRLVASLRTGDALVDSAMRRIPRHRFVSMGLWPTAYVDTPLPIGPEATVSAPHMVALQLSLARIRPGQRVMELGSGSGYLVAIASLQVGPEGLVVGVEYEESLVERSLRTLVRLGIPVVGSPHTAASTNIGGGVKRGARSTVSIPGREPGSVRIVPGNGFNGAPTLAPFDRIIVSYAGPPPAGEPWLDQLGPEGIAVVPVETERDYTEIQVWERTASGWRTTPGPACLFVRRKA